MEQAMYEVTDQNIPENDPEVVQVEFYTQEDVDALEPYVLTITYDIFYEHQEPDPFCTDSDIDYYGFTDCDAQVHQIEIHKRETDADTRYEWGLGERVDDINVDDVLSKEHWKKIQQQVEENYIKYVKTMREEI